VGGLIYTIDTANSGSGAAGGELCGGEAFSTTDPDLSADSSGLQDSRPDSPSDPNATLTYTVNLSQCLRAAGRAWNVGDVVKVFLVARSVSGDTASGGGFYFRRG
jgi:hypothetical protein